MVRAAGLHGGRACRSGYGASALDDPERGFYSLFFFKDRRLRQSNFRDAGFAVAVGRQLDHRIDDRSKADRAGQNHLVVGHSAGGWAALAPSSENLPGVRAIIASAAGRGGRVGGRRNNNCAPDRLVAATAESGRAARTPMLRIYIENDTFFGPELSRRVTRPIPGLAETRNITCFLRSAATRSPGQFARRHSAMGAAGRTIPQQARTKLVP